MHHPRERMTSQGRIMSCDETAGATKQGSSPVDFGTNLSITTEPESPAEVRVWFRATLGEHPSREPVCKHVMLELNVRVTTSND